MPLMQTLQARRTRPPGLTLGYSSDRLRNGAFRQVLDGWVFIHRTWPGSAKRDLWKEIFDLPPVGRAIGGWNCVIWEVVKVPWRPNLWKWIPSIVLWYFTLLLGKEPALVWEVEHQLPPIHNFGL